MFNSNSNKVLVFIIVCLIFISITACSGGSTEASRDSNTDNKDDFESYTQYIGKPIGDYDNSLENGKPLTIKGRNEISYETSTVSIWNNIRGIITVDTNDNNIIIRFSLVFTGTYLSGDSFDEAQAYLEEKYGKGEKLTDDIVDYYFDDYYFRLMRDRCVLGWNEEHLTKDVSNSGPDESISIDPEVFERLASWLGLNRTELNENSGNVFKFSKLSDDIGFGEYDYEYGKITISFKTNDDIIFNVTWRPFATHDSVSSEDADSTIQALTETYGGPTKTETLDNKATQYKFESDSFIVDRYIYHTDGCVIIGSISKADGTNISDVAIRFSEE